MKTKITYIVSTVLICLSLIIFIFSCISKVTIDKLLLEEALAVIPLIIILPLTIIGIVIGFILSLITFIINIIKINKVTNKIGIMIFAILGLVLVICNIILFILVV